jgi:hypothetical protein
MHAAQEIIQGAMAGRPDQLTIVVCATTQPSLWLCSLPLFCVQGHCDLMSRADTNRPACGGSRQSIRVFRRWTRVEVSAPELIWTLRSAVRKRVNTVCIYSER